MHSSLRHRARVVAEHPAHTEPKPDTSSAHLRHQGELFRRLHARAHADLTQETQTIDETSNIRCESYAFDSIAACSDEARDGSDHGEHSNDDDGNEEPQESESRKNIADSLPGTSLLAPGSFVPNVAALHDVHAMKRFAVSETPSANEAASVVEPDMRRLVESIVTRIADFSSNPAVLERGDWHFTIPLDPALLPDCTLNLTFSRFTLTLRFDTFVDRSATLLSQHTDALRKSLDDVMRDRFGTPSSIEIIVT
ncbi:type III secretion system protein SctP [Paraburkholderia sp. SARCC-3016]|uniref:type III secretion system protein SctP n=1 Tax=Paraburkholderia sp. SARCC-3016 TaxID=3058611 RepID=UPI002809C3DF|nr:type III secretion system protein SctP [Paraburkholderia sp. SARCC-3016]MDQ7980268.1 type III secretion system protein SctP [Paraburkholderia sp. SARCC-3016]